MGDASEKEAEQAIQTEAKGNQRRLSNFSFTTLRGVLQKSKEKRTEAQAAESQSENNAAEKTAEAEASGAPAGESDVSDQKKEAAAIKIQSTHRGNQDRKSAKEAKKHKEEANAESKD